VKARPQPPRLALRPEEAAEALGCSRSHFDRFIGPELRAVRTGRLVLYPVREVEAFLERAAAYPLGADRP
jgi:excisionase family DNA binding protein